MKKMPSIENRKTVSRSLKAPSRLALRAEHETPRNTYRTTFMRDRDRVLYSAPFRLLAGKTQVYITGIDDNMRTRLTHTLEVAQIAKTIATVLRLDVDLVEAIALGHDIGHTPYGHAGERVLHAIMNPQPDHPIKGSPFDVSSAEIHQITEEHTSAIGFKHNLHSVEVAINEAEKTANQSLSLSNFALYGMCAHSSSSYGDHSATEEQKVGYYKKFKKYYEMNGHNAWSFEAFVVEEADEIAQRHHDLEDAIRGNLLSPKVVHDQISRSFSEFFTKADKKILRNMKKLEGGNQLVFYAELSRLVVNLLVTRLIHCSIRNLNVFIDLNKMTELKFAGYMIDHDGIDERNLIGYDYTSDRDRPFSAQLDSFKRSISSRVLDAYDIQRADAKGIYIIRKVAQALYSSPQQLPDDCLIDYYTTTNEKQYAEVLSRISQEGIGGLRRECIKEIHSAQNSTPNRDSQKKLVVLLRTICNYIAGMTDHSIQILYQDLYG